MSASQTEPRSAAQVVEDRYRHLFTQEMQPHLLKAARGGSWFLMYPGGLPALCMMRAGTAFQDFRGIFDRTRGFLGEESIWLSHPVEPLRGPGGRPGIRIRELPPSNVASARTTEVAPLIVLQAEDTEDPLSALFAFAEENKLPASWVAAQQRAEYVTRELAAIERIVNILSTYRPESR